MGRAAHGAPTGLYTLIDLAVVCCLAIVYAGLQPRYNLADQVPNAGQAMQASARLDAQLTGENPIDVLIEFPDGANLYDAATLATIAEVHDVVEQQTGVGNVWSIETLRRWLAQQPGKSDVGTLKQYIELLPQFLVRRFVSADQKEVIVSARVPNKDSARLLPIVKQLNSRLDAVRAQHPGYTIAVTGLSVIAARNSAGMIDKLNRALTAEFVFVAAFVGLAFRSLAVAPASLLAGIFPVLAAGALLRLLGQGLQFASVVALMVSFGLGSERDDPFPQPHVARRSPRPRSGDCGRAGHGADRTGADPDDVGARLRSGDARHSRRFRRYASLAGSAPSRCWPRWSATS